MSFVAVQNKSSMASPLKCQQNVFFSKSIKQEKDSTDFALETNACNNLIQLIEVEKEKEAGSSMASQQNVFLSKPIKQEKDSSDFALETNACNNLIQLIEVEKEKEAGSSMASQLNCHQIVFLSIPIMQVNDSSCCALEINRSSNLVKEVKKEKQALHLKSITPVKPYKCKECSMSFLKRYKLETHMQYRCKKRPATCEVCGKTLSTEGNLKTHMLIHTGKKRFVCQFCKKSFVSKSQLDSHMRSNHYRVKEFECDVCGKSYVLKQSLKVHLLTHIQRSHLNTNLPVHAKADPFQCELSKEFFSDKQTATSGKKIKLNFTGHHFTFTKQR